MKVCFENDKTNALSNGLSIIDEELLRYGLPTDVWFHVECVIAVTILLVMRLTFRQQAFVRACLSSPIGWPTSREWDKLPAALVNDLAQLVKANSIEGVSSLSDDPIWG